MFLTNRIFDDNLLDFSHNDFIFNSSVKAMSPTAFYKKDNDYIIEAKTLGINPDDIKISVDGNVLLISGETKNEYSEKNFNVKIKVVVGEEILNNIQSIEYKSNNGITYVILKMKEKKTNNIFIKKI